MQHVQHLLSRLQRWSWEGSDVHLVLLLGVLELVADDGCMSAFAAATMLQDSVQGAPLVNVAVVDGATVCQMLAFEDQKLLI